MNKPPKLTPAQRKRIEERNRKSRPEDVVFSIRILKRTREDLAKLAMKNGIKVNALIRHVLEEYANADSST